MTEQHPIQDAVMLEETESAFDWSEYQEDLQELCAAKAEEFALLGYEDVTPEAIWACVAAKWKHMPALHAAVADILGLQIGRFMNHVTISAYKGEFGEEDNPFAAPESSVFDRPIDG